MVRKAIIPAAGLGTRVLPASKTVTEILQSLLPRQQPISFPKKWLKASKKKPAVLFVKN